MKAMRIASVLWEWLLLAGVCGVFLFLTARRPGLPGIAYDEVMEPNFGMAAVENIYPRVNAVTDQYAAVPTTDWFVTLAGREWPLRAPHPYDWSGFIMYLAAAVFRFAGISIRTLRMAEIAMAAAMIVLFFVFCRFWLPGPWALAAALLLAVNPAFVIWGRLCFWAVEMLAAFFALAAAACFARWWRSKSRAALYWGCFFLGFGVNVSIKIFAFWVAYPILYLLFVPRERRLRGAELFFCGLTFAAGAANFIIFNVVHGFPVFRVLLIHLWVPTARGVDNLHIAGNMAVRWGQLVNIFNGQLPALSTGGGGAPVSRFLPGLFVLSFLWLLAKCIWDKRWSLRKPAAVILSLCGILYLCICFTPAALSAEHPFILWPFAVLVIVLSIFSLFEIRGFGGIGRWLAVGCFVAAAAWSWRFDRAYFSTLESTKGEGFWSSAPTDAAYYLGDKDAETVVCLAWGMAEQIYFVSKGKIIPDDGFSFIGGVSPRLLAAYRGWLRDPTRRYLMRAGPATRFNGRAALEEALREGRRRLVLEKTFNDGLGSPMLLLYRAVKEPAGKS